MLRYPGKRWLLPNPRRIWRFLKNDNVPAWRKAIVYLALGYVVFPFDAIPDLAPIAGWLDDLGVASAALLFLSWALGDEPPEELAAPKTDALGPDKDDSSR
jgi:uncharacterized membrane protein YkvA (DUF1232 family)